mgnify:CR=1 FL=1
MNIIYLNKYLIPYLLRIYLIIYIISNDAKDNTVVTTNFDTFVFSKNLLSNQFCIFSLIESFTYWITL